MPEEVYLVELVTQRELVARDTDCAVRPLTLGEYVDVALTHTLLHVDERVLAQVLGAAEQKEEGDQNGEVDEEAVVGLKPQAAVVVDVDDLLDCHRDLALVGPAEPLEALAEEREVGHRVCTDVQPSTVLVVRVAHAVQPGVHVVPRVAHRAASVRVEIADFVLQVFVARLVEQEELPSGAAPQRPGAERSAVGALRAVGGRVREELAPAAADVGGSRRPTHHARLLPTASGAPGALPWRLCDDAGILAAPLRSDDRAESVVAENVEVSSRRAAARVDAKQQR